MELTTPPMFMLQMALPFYVQVIICASWGSPAAKRHKLHQASALYLIPVARSLNPPSRYKVAEPFVCHSPTDTVKTIFNAGVTEPL